MSLLLLALRLATLLIICVLAHYRRLEYIPLLAALVFVVNVIDERRERR